MRRVLIVLGIVGAFNTAWAQTGLPSQAYVLPPEPPSNGVGYIITGSIFLGLGVLNLATAPLCKTDAVAEDMQDTCLYASLGVGGAFVAVGTPLLIVGIGKRSTYNEWRRQHPYAALLTGLGFSVGGRNTGMSWRITF
jgi:hypothetical protein